MSDLLGLLFDCNYNWQNRLLGADAIKCFSGIPKAKFVQVSKLFHEPTYLHKKQTLPGKTFFDPTHLLFADVILI